MSYVVIVLVAIALVAGVLLLTSSRRGAGAGRRADEDVTHRPHAAALQQETAELKERSGRLHGRRVRE